MPKCPKFCVGPASSRPGPMLLIVAATAVKLVVRSFPSNETRNTDTTNVNINVIIYTFTERITSCSTGFPSTLIFFTLLGWI